MERYYIVRDANSRGDVAVVWNWKRRGWCWDLDGEYTAEDGFAYGDMRSAAVRSRAIIEQEASKPFRYENAYRADYSRIRVVDNGEFRNFLELGS